MNWLFEPTLPPYGAGELPAELIDDLMQGGQRGVSLLEFAAMEDRAEPPVQAMAAELTSSEGEAEREAQERAHTLAAMVDAARQTTEQEVRASVGAAFEASLHAQQERVDALTAAFARDRQRFFAAAEGQVVRLAISIAEKILTREIAQDAMHLAGTVKAALRQVQDEVGTVLRVPVPELDAWRQLLAGPVNATCELVADDRLDAGACVLETAIGRMELSVPVQLAEIRRGFEQLIPQTEATS